MKRLLLMSNVLPATIAVLVALAPSHARAGEDSWEGRNAVGISVGIPQMIALTGEMSFIEPVRVQGSVGSALIVSSANIRALAILPTRPLRPYGFIGGGVMYEFPTDTGHAEGTTGFYWYGAGVRIEFSRLVLFGDIGRLEGLDTAKGFDARMFAMSAGLLFKL